MSKPYYIRLGRGDKIEGEIMQHRLTGEVMVLIRRADGTLTEERGPRNSHVVGPVDDSDPVPPLSELLARNKPPG
jgi:hypothetical protein